MIECGERLRFTIKACEPFRVRGNGIRQHLDRHLPRQTRIGGAIHFAHAAGAEERLDLEWTETRAAGERHSASILRAVQTGSTETVMCDRVRPEDVSKSKVPARLPLRGGVSCHVVCSISWSLVQSHSFHPTRSHNEMPAWPRHLGMR